MYKITKIDSLGSDYTVSDASGNVLKVIQIITQSEILDAALGEYKEGYTFSSYLDRSIALMTGFENLDPNKVLWYATYDTEIVLTKIIEYAVRNGYEKIILEHLDHVD